MEFPTIVTTRKVVPNLQPLIDPGTARIALVGEAPGEDEENHGVPFFGRSGQFLDRCLAEVGISRSNVFVGNVCQVRPPSNKITAFPWDQDEIQSGLERLRLDLREFNPHITVLLGNTPLHAAKANRPLTAPRKGNDDDEEDDDKENKRYPFKITAWRGSLFNCSLIDSALKDWKCVPSLHPANVLRQFSGYPLLRFDLSRAVEEARTPELILPQRELLTNLDASHLCYIMDNWPAGLRCSVDIEGGLPEQCVNESVKADSKKRRHIGWRCVSLSARPSRAYVIAWWKFDDLDKARLLRSFARLMERVDVPKVLQNSLYDAFVMAYGYNIHIRNIAEDVMAKGWEVYSELRKGLSTQASIWTREPHWKDEEMYESTGENLAVGCGKDTCVTLEICEAQDGVLKGGSLMHYRANMELITNPLLYMELRGIRYDTETVKIQREEVKKDLATLGATLNTMAGSELRGKKGSLSAQRLAKVLYEVKNYPPQYKKEHGRKTTKVTTDVEAILSLRKHLPTDDFLSGILRHRHLEGLLETLSILPDPDGRVRCGYNAVGTETGRLTCYTSPTGAGANLQTITKKLRKLYVADPGYDFFQCDLSGADGWTVASHCARLGDPTMLDDYYFGLKPAKILALLYALGADINALDRDSLKNACRAVDPDSWQYFASKRVQHGTNYMMGVPTLMTQVMKDSFKLSGVPIYMEHAQAAQLQSLYHLRYRGLRTWHQWSEAALVSKGELTSASGQTRMFFGRRFGNDIRETIKEWLSHEPQSNTTWANNLALLKLWNDPENRIAKVEGRVITTCAHTQHYIPAETVALYSWLRPGCLLIEPLHTVHDANCGQWPQFVRKWAAPRMHYYFDNPLTIADRQITIPFEGAYGPSWGELPNPI